MSVFKFNNLRTVGFKDQEVQPKSTPVVQIEDNNLQPIDMVEDDQTIIDNSSPDPHNEPVVAAETPITEEQSVTRPTSEVLAQTTLNLLWLLRQA